MPDGSLSEQESTHNDPVLDLFAEELLVLSPRVATSLVSLTETCSP